MKFTYDRLAVGERLRIKRNLLGITQDEMAEKIDRVPKYYADIERGSCGMSIETLLALSISLNMDLDYLVWGKGEDSVNISNDRELMSIMSIIKDCSPKKRNHIIKILKILFIACEE
ncbi:MAG: helix-turn-helix transcriptional regulator [Eubacteriales bacterium]